MKEEEGVIMQQIANPEILEMIGVTSIAIWIWLSCKSGKLKQRLLLLFLVMMAIVSFVGMIASVSFVSMIALFVHGLIVPSMEGTIGNFIGNFIINATLLFVINFVLFLLSVVQLKDYFSEK